MATRTEKAGTEMTLPPDGIRFELPTEPIIGKCCWHCRFYSRPSGLIGVDVPLGSICAVDWDRRTYRPHDGLAPGEKYTNPDNSCDKFEALTQK